MTDESKIGHVFVVFLLLHLVKEKARSRWKMNMHIIASVSNYKNCVMQRKIFYKSNEFSKVVSSVDDTPPKTLVLSMRFDNTNMKPGQKVTALL